MDGSSRTEGANRNIFPAGFYDRELVLTLHNVKMTFKLNAQVDPFTTNVIYIDSTGFPPARRCNRIPN